MMSKAYRLAESHRPKPFLTISNSLHMGEKENSVTCFSMGCGTDISPETYENPLLYIGAGGNGKFVCDGAETEDFHDLEILYVPGSTLCGAKAGKEGFVYTEIFMRKDTIMTELLKAGEITALKNLIDYEEGSIANLDIARNETMKFVLMAFDEGCALSPHKAPGDAIVFALEGKATIGYEGKDYTISEGEIFRFEKEGLHSVAAQGKFKMALLLVLK